MNEILIALGSSIATGFGQWVFYYRKHKATAIGAEKGNDRTEIENYKLIAQEWRESAERWKDMADKYQMELIEYKKELSSIEGKLIEALNKINCLESRLSKE